jgi:hypothetical protein
VNKAQKRQEELQTLEMDYFMLLDKCVRDLGVLATSSLPSAFPEVHFRIPFSSQNLLNSFLEHLQTWKEDSSLCPINKSQQRGLC